MSADLVTPAVSPSILVYLAAAVTATSPRSTLWSVVFVLDHGLDG
jgi:hypothetical protein